MVHLYIFLGQRPAAIVSPIEGTTRDLLEVALDIGGYPIVITDTAGLRSETKDVIEKEGISRALQSSEAADLVILVVDCLKYLQWIKTERNRSFAEFLSYTINKLQLNDSMFSKDCIIVFNKIDAIDDKDKCFFDESKTFFISCKTEFGFNDLVSEIAKKLKQL